MVDMQEYFDLKMQEFAFERSKNMVTLGELISMLKTFDRERSVFIGDVELGYEVTPICLSSYRGYYSDLQIEYAASAPDVTVGELTAWLEEAIGKTYCGYKGGDFTMSKITPVWVDNCGSCRGVAVSEVVEIDGRVVIKTVSIED